MESEFTFINKTTNKESNYTLTLNQVLKNRGVYQPEGWEEGQIITFGQNIAIWSTDNYVEAIDKEAWKGHLFRQLPLNVEIVLRDQ